MKRLLKLFIIGTLLVVLSPTITLAYTASVSSNFSLKVPDTVLTVNGYASPNALISILDGNTTIGTTVASLDGSFSKSFFAQTPGIHTISVNYKDPLGLYSTTNTQDVSIIFRNETVLTALLSPTIFREGSTELVKGSLLQIRGNTIPGSIVRLSLQGTNLSYNTTSNANGAYQFLISTSELVNSDYVATVSVQIGTGTSQSSELVNFKIIPASGVNDITIVGVTTLQPPVVTNPNDGVVADGDTITITGEAKPYAQIFIYENGIKIGSVFVDANGKWKFVYHLKNPSTVLTFQACDANRCSIISRPLSLNSRNVINGCNANLTLKNYRFWDESVGQEINLEVDQISADGIVDIDWGDGHVDRFNVISKGRNNLAKVYHDKGRFSGKITFREGHDESNECYIDHYFSVDVNKDEPPDNLSWIIFVMIPILFLLTLYRRSTFSKNNQ